MIQQTKFKTNRTSTHGLWTRWACIPLFCALVFAAASPGCQSGKTKKQADKTAGKKNAAVKNIITMKKAKVNIPLSEIDSAWKYEVPDQSKMQIVNMENWRQQFLDSWIEKAVMAEMARKKKLQNSEEYKTMIHTKETLLLAGIFFNKVMRPEFQKIKIPPAEVEKYYQEHKDQWFQGWREVNHIIVNDEALAGKLYTRLSANPTGFAAAAKQNSIDEDTKNTGGVLGKVFRNDSRIPSEVEKAYLSTPKGQVSKPAKSRLGWHLVLVKNASPAEMDYQPLNDTLKKQINNVIIGEKSQDMYKKLMARYKEELGLEVNDKLVPEIGREWQKEWEKMMRDMQGMPMQMSPHGGGQQSPHGQQSPQRPMPSGH